MAGSATSWAPPPLPGQGNVAAPAPTRGEDSVSHWLSDVWQGQVASAQRVGWMLNWFGSQAVAGITPTPESQLADLIYKKLGPIYTVAGKGPGPDSNYILAHQVAHQAMTDPNYRQQLTQSLGWNQNNPHVAFWVTHGGGLPSDPTGTGLPPGAVVPGQPKAATAATPTVTAASPFPASAWKGRASDPGYTYGQLLAPQFAAAAGVDRQWGVDYAMPAGTPLSAPFAGQVTEADFNGPYGNTVVIKLANGQTYRVAHLQGINVQVGAKVNAGMLLGTVGSTGNSTGPHVLIEMRDSRGKPIDPTAIIDSLLKGDYTTAEAAIPGPLLTTDGHLVYPGSQEFGVFSMVQQIWRKRYGTDPPWSFVSGLIAAGNTTAAQVQSAMDQMTSDIAGLNWGARDALANDANQQSFKAWDRPVPDSVIKQLAAKGITTPGQIAGWINSHPANAIAPDDYKSIYDATNPKTQELWQQPPSPDMIKHIYDQMNAGPG